MEIQIPDRERGNYYAKSAYFPEGFGEYGKLNVRISSGIATFFTGDLSRHVELKAFLIKLSIDHYEIIDLIVYEDAEIRFNQFRDLIKNKDIDQLIELVMTEVPAKHLISSMQEIYQKGIDDGKNLKVVEIRNVLGFSEGY